MKNIIGYIYIGSFLVFLLFSPKFVHAQGAGPKLCGTNNSGIETAIGCIDTTPHGFVGTLLKLSIGIAGGIAFLMILLGGLQIQTSTGNPDRLNQGKEVVEGAIIGLLLIVLSIFILKVVGVDILGIPGFHQ